MYTYPLYLHRHFVSEALTSIIFTRERFATHITRELVPVFAFTSTKSTEEKKDDERT